MATSDDDSKVLGVVLIVRHGDRQGFYQDPTNYFTPSNTAITALGSWQSFDLGSKIRNLYLEPSSPSFISGIDSTIVQDNEIKVRADAGGEGGVIFNSAVSILQGLFPPSTQYTSELSNGTIVTGPMSGYQTVPIESVEPSNDVSLEGWTDCSPFATATNVFYNSTQFKQVADANEGFLNALSSFIDGPPLTLQNMWNVYDFMNVQSIHNATFLNSLPHGYLQQARDLANFHEYNIFSSPQIDGIGNIAGQTILPSIISGLQAIADLQNPQKMMIQAVSYKPFISLFNMIGAVEMNSSLAGIVEYSAALALEVREPHVPGDVFIRLKFKNGTEDNFNTYGFMNSTTSDVAVPTFINAMKPHAFSDLPTWCRVCENTQDRGCADLIAVPTSASTITSIHDHISPVGAGFIGACVTLALVTALLVLLSFAGFVAFSFKTNRRVKKYRGSSDIDSERSGKWIGQ